MIRPNNLSYTLPILLFTAIFVLLLSPLCPTAQVNSNLCETSYGKCGAFGICNSQASPICTCLQGFQPRNSRDWDSGNWSSGCVRSVPLSCEGSNGGREDAFVRLQLNNLTGYHSYWWLGPEIRCKARCLRDCLCLAYAFHDDPGCMFWNGTLIDFHTSPTASQSNLYFRLSNPKLDKKKDSKKIVIILVVVGLVFLSISTYFSWRWIAKHRGKKKTIQVENAGSVEAFTEVNLEELPLFKFEILANATNNFSEANKLGKGGFGPVYKGVLANGREIAVKRLSQTSTQGMQEFMNEVLLITKLQHRNLVRLLGCCVENKETMLVYEYMPNKSLNYFLFDSSQEILDWRKRFKVIEGICRGLLYLHRDSRSKIIHRDLKASNILLDNDWNPKISDFGLARIFGTKQDHASTVRVVGTFGYIAPEFAIRGRFSEKSDVYSLGVVMLEIVAGRRSTRFNHQDGSFNLVRYVWKLWNEDNVSSLIDRRISSLSHRDEVMKCIHIGLLCVQELPQNRPYISDVLPMLNSEIIKLPEPKKPAFVITSFRQSQESSSSTNNVTLTTINGR